MSKTNIIIIVVVVLLGIGGWLVFSNKEGDSMMKGDESSMQKTDEIQMEKKDTMVKDDSMMKSEEMMSKGAYEIYSPEKVALASKGKVVLFFRATWCPTCKALDANIRANLNNIPAGVTVLDVNYDDSSALKQKYGVTYQHTLVQVDSNGNQIVKWSGSPTLSDLVSRIK